MSHSFKKHKKKNHIQNKRPNLFKRMLRKVYFWGVKVSQKKKQRKDREKPAVLLAQAGAKKGLLGIKKFYLSFMRNIFDFAKKTKQKLFEGVMTFAGLLKNAVLLLVHRLSGGRGAFKAVGNFAGKHSHTLISSGLVAAAVFVIGYTVISYDVGLNVYLGDDVVARVLNQQDFEDYVACFDQQVSDEIGETFQSELSYYYEFAFIKKGEEGVDSSLSQKILQNVSDVRTMAVLSVDGQIIGANTKEAIESILEKIKQANSTGDATEEQEFAKDVKVEEKLCSTNLYKSVSEIEKILEQPEQKEMTYMVENGDTLSAIAPKYNMTTSQLMTLNSEVDPEKMHPGDEIVVSKEIPMLPVENITTVEYTVEIPYETIKQNDSTLYINRTSIVQAGVKGVNKIVAKITTISGEEVSREIVSEEVISQPIQCVMKVGTKPVPAGVPTGIFMWPTSGTVTSPYGYRSGGEFHTGIDIANSYGTSIKAADGGTVRFAGWNGNYGYCVIITHENGLETLYAHCSKLYVSAGQSVKKGFAIAAMGSTGRSTGNHLHFEVRQNGKTRNPIYALP